MDQVYQLNRTGDHRPRGLFLATGPDLNARRLNHLTSVNDFASTIAALLGTTLPGTDGSPIPALAPKRWGCDLLVTNRLFIPFCLPCSLLYSLV
jgi:hypothetical protein